MPRLDLIKIQSNINPLQKLKVERGRGKKIRFHRVKKIKVAVVLLSKYSLKKVFKRKNFGGFERVKKKNFATKFIEESL